MINFANKTIIPLAVLAESVDATDTTIVSRPPTILHHNLGELSRLMFKRARVKAGVRLNQQATAGKVTMRLKAGTRTLVTRVMALTGKSYFAMDVDVSIDAIGGGENIRIEVEVNEACQAGTLLNYAGDLVVEHPVVISA